MGVAGPVLVHGGSDGNWLAWAMLFPQAGTGVLVVDASFQLLKAVCSRVYVMKQGRITGEHELDDFATAERLVETYLQEGS